MKENVILSNMEEAFFNFVYSLIETAMNDGYVSEIRYDGTHLILDEDMQHEITKLMKE